MELAKFSLRSDIESLEKSINCEKEAHCETKNRLMLQEHECATLRVDRRRYVIKALILVEDRDKSYLHSFT